MCPHHPVCLLYLLHLQPLPTIGTFPSTCTHVLAFSVPKIKIKKQKNALCVCTYLQLISNLSPTLTIFLRWCLCLLPPAPYFSLFLDQPGFYYQIPTTASLRKFINNFILVRTTGHFGVLFPKYFLVCLIVLTIPFLLKLYSFGYHDTLFSWVSS